MVKIKTRLRAAREAQGLSQPDFARLVGISESLLRQLESGRTTPTERVAALLHTALNEKAETLLKPVKVGRLPRIQNGGAQ
jgi:transcriptional regulator with XRE-family HTH domain